MTPAIQIDKLSKMYQIGAASNGHYDTIRESVASAFTKTWRRFRGDKAPSKATDTFWALKDVSFSVQPGEVVGIIGRNGAGKSTLLKILSRTVEPTGGRAEIRGRLGSLLEVGTGFHPELTGRENIYLNGSILGMKRREINQRFDEIVAFSEIEKFLETPVKRYSSGMYVRLAFAVAAHLESEVLIVDEVLAVGDMEFQKKCMGKMQDVGRHGKAVLFVSHNMQAIESLCHRGIHLRNGSLAVDAPVKTAVRNYLKAIEETASQDLSGRQDRQGNGVTRLVRASIESLDPVDSGRVTMGRPAQITFELGRHLPGVSCVFHITDQFGTGVAKFNSKLVAPLDQVGPSTSPVLTCVIDEWSLAPGRYRLDVAIWAGGELVDLVEGAVMFDACRGHVRDREPPRSSGDWKTIMPHTWKLPS